MDGVAYATTFAGHLLRFSSRSTTISLLHVCNKIQLLYKEFYSCNGAAPEKYPLYLYICGGGNACNIEGEVSYLYLMQFDSLIPRPLQLFSVHEKGGRAWYATACGGHFT